MCYCSNVGEERTLNKHTKLTLEKKILLPLLEGFEPATFRLQVWRSTNKLPQLSNSNLHNAARQIHFVTKSNP